MLQVIFNPIHVYLEQKFIWKCYFEVSCCEVLSIQVHRTEIRIMHLCICYDFYCFNFNINFI